jgi:pimeloyl-ACP methyl ester carboxylesterase
VAFAQNGHVRLWFERHGRANDPVVLLLSGAGKQGKDSPDAFCRKLVDRNFSVIRFDQRDTGKSTNFSNAGSDALGVATAMAEGRALKLAYSAGDLAADALAVLDAAKVNRAHLMGRSLGAYVAQHFALDHPATVRSLTLVMAFSRSIGTTTSLERLAQLDAEHFTTVDAFVDRQVATARAIGNPDYFDQAQIRADAALAYKRGVHQGAIARHFTVGLAAPDLRARLAEIKVPTQIIHGRLDKVIPLALGEETAAGIAGAKLAVLDDMAHEGPPQLWDRWISLFAQNAAHGD